MPQFSDRLPHLLLRRAESSLPYRPSKSRFPPIRPNRGERKDFGEQLETATEQLQAPSTPAVIPGINPHLIFRIPTAEGTNADDLTNKLDSLGITVLEIDKHGTLVVFRSDDDLSQFIEAIKLYEDGPKINPRTGHPFKSTSSDIFEIIEPSGMRKLLPEDRLGSRLNELLEGQLSNIDDEKIYLVEAELWRTGPSKEDFQRSLSEVRALVNNERGDNERVCDWFWGKSLDLVKLRITGAKLRILLRMDLVAEIDLPLQPDIDPVEVRQITIDDFIVESEFSEGGPQVCVIDSGIAIEHPLLKNNIAHAESFLSSDDLATDASGHGTMVAGLAIYGDIREAYAHRQFSSSVGIISARVLNEHNKFDDDNLIIKQVSDIIHQFSREPYTCRVFNISLGSRHQAFLTSRQQTAWAEELDNVAKDLKVVLVVSAGNYREPTVPGFMTPEEVLEEYPNYLNSADAQLCDPATAAIAITVGSLIQHDIPSARNTDSDIKLPVGGKNCPSPFTRRGPGVSQSVKPDFVHYGGGLAVEGTGLNRLIQKNDGVSTMSLSFEHARSLFTFGNGTSYAAPQVSRLAALLQYELREQFQIDDPNLIRSILAVSADVPDQAIELSAIKKCEPLINVSCGYGLPDEERALGSSADRVTLISTGKLQAGNFHVYQIPNVDAYVNSEGDRRIVIGLAFDPPVRRRTRYLGVEMDFALFRNIEIEDLIERLKAREEEEDLEDENIPYRVKLDLHPAGSPRGEVGHRRSSTLQRAECIISTAKKIKDTEEFLLVVKAIPRWGDRNFEQDYALAVTLESASELLYAQVREKLRIQQRIRLQA